MTWRGATVQPVGTTAENRRGVEVPQDAALWADFAAAPAASSFFGSWLAIQCGFVARSVAGVLLVDEAEGGFAVAATWPNGNRDVAHLAAAAGPALKQRRSTVHYAPDCPGQPKYACVAHPVEV